ncbi:helix-turn-helix domain-containing protein [Lignipirellula cremea]|uniref:Helix-turn-helix domain protein n=1 Tax=Lignipirellula cremea TaxID=2528010 RepID=A0A518E3X2_9BACT|nr:helix-turn-helix domain-containing protein [Lignipirellula cremea]QDU98787.1 Helix-turn-helix domain protein [Lignipirellula cremea]
MLQSEGFLRVKDAAIVLGVSPNTVRAWGAEGKIPEYRHPVNNYRLYKRAELERILKKLEQSRSPETPGARKKRAK